MGKTSKHKGARPKRKHLRKQAREAAKLRGKPGTELKRILASVGIKPKQRYGSFIVPRELLQDSQIDLYPSLDSPWGVPCSGYIPMPRSRPSG